MRFCFFELSKCLDKIQAMNNLRNKTLNVVLSANNLRKNGSVKVDKFNTPVNGQNATLDYQFFKCHNTHLRMATAYSRNDKLNVLP